jgi:hypothetical protein
LILLQGLPSAGVAPFQRYTEKLLLKSITI